MNLQEIVETIEELKSEYDYSFDEAVKLLQLVGLKDIIRISEEINSVLDDIGRAIDRTNDSINAIEEDIRTGKAFVKGEISTYNLN
ncbi:hypothetical protein GPK74_12295 [Coprococcus catus]|uniref:hypothetical protein n=1 Tax=Coprococcus catus TaxID=116085 RepID=UPI001C02327D|nr:hypothetical protein [Coprococcus catus]MBT9770720.1 hypothetical protein [Coprococcus catus]